LYALSGSAHERHSGLGAGIGASVAEVRCCGKADWPVGILPVCPARMSLRWFPKSVNAFRIGQADLHLVDTRNQGVVSQDSIDAARTCEVYVPHSLRERETEARGRGIAAMNVLHERVDALEKIGAGALADQALLKLVRLHLQKYEKHLAEVQKELECFEQHYGISSEECYERFMAGKMGDAADIVEWMGLYDNVLLYRERIETLRAAAAVP
jgi:hypothetical protein